jgi:hypothetical protein
MEPGQHVRVTVNLDLDPWTDLRDNPRYKPGGAVSPKVVRIGLLPNGTSGRRATVMILAEMPDGSLVPVETTWRLFNTAARALAASPVAQMEDL